jgi:hypothetical protein
LRTLALLVALLAAAATAGAAPLPSLNDEFVDSATTDQWQVMQGDLADGVAPTFDIAKTTPGELTITPGRSWWVDGTRAFYLYKPVVGDFVVTARLRVTGRDGAVPTADWSLSGLLVRRPTENRAQENWVSFRIGRRGGKDVFERKTTVPAPRRSCSHPRNRPGSSSGSRGSAATSSSCAGTARARSPRTSPTSVATCRPH